MKNKKFKNFIDESISPYPIFRKEEKENIMDQISNLNEKKIVNEIFFPRVMSAVVVSLICLFVIGLGIHQSGIKGISTSREKSTQKTDHVITQNKKEFSLPNQATINKKVEELMSNFSLGMTMEEVKKTFGNNYETLSIQDPEGTKLEAWKYELYDNPTIPKSDIPPGDIDIDRFKNLNAGIEFFIIWNSSKTKMATLTYVSKKTKVVTVLTFKPDGSSAKKEY